MDDPRKVTIGIVAVGLAALVGLMLLVGAGQTTTILSKVGASISGGEAVTSGDQQPAAGNGGDPGGGSGGGGATGQGGQAAAAAPKPPTLLIVRTGSLTLEVTSLASTVSAAAALVNDAAGFVAGSKESGAAADASATVDYRIPATAWERTLTALRGLATVRGQEIKSDEVTGTVVDLGARIANLRATEAALQAIMARAVRIQDVLDVQTQLTDTRGQIEQLSAQKSELEDRAAYGSLTVTFRPPPAPRPTATLAPGWDPATDVDQATAKLVRIGQRATTAGIWFAIVGLPILLALGVALLVAWAAARLVVRLRTRSEPAPG